MIVDFAIKRFCPELPDQEECAQLAESLLPVAVEWLRASATPASLCSAVGVCGPAILGDSLYDKAPARLTDGFECPVCKHVIRAVERDAAAAADAVTKAGGSAATSRSALVPVETSQAGGSGEAAGAGALLASAVAACQQLPGELGRECAAAMEKRGALLSLAVGASGGRDATTACELLGMCVAGLGRLRPQPLAPQLVTQMDMVRSAAAALLLQGRTAQPGQESQSSQQELQGGLGDNRCDMCKLTVLELTTLLSNPSFQDSLRTYGEAMCDSSVPSSYSVLCKQYVDTYLPVLLDVLRTHIQPDRVCTGLHLCQKQPQQPRLSTWQGLVAVLRTRGAAVLNRIVGGGLGPNGNQRRV